MSWSWTPENALVTRLKIRDSTRRESRSRRLVFQPETRSKPSSSFASRRGISAGSSCRSPSIVTTVSPRAWSKPATSAAALPKFRRNRTTRTLSAALCRRVSAAKVPSDDPSSTKIASHAVSTGSSAERSSSYSSATLRSSLCTGTTTEITAARLPRRYAGREMAELLSLAEAQARVLEQIAPLEGERVAVAAAAGRVLAEDALAAVDLPPFPSSAMDGFALRASDTPGRLPVVARIAAGVPAPRPLRGGEAMAIATGGVVPEGADVVVPIEYVVEYDNSVEINEAVAQNAHIRPRGGDVRVGDVIVERGTRITPAHIGALAAAGVERVSCGRHPRVAVLSTGTELRRPGERLRPGQVYEANGAMLASALAASGALVAALPSVPDDEASHRDALERALA